MGKIVTKAQKINEIVEFYRTMGQDFFNGHTYRTTKECLEAIRTYFTAASPDVVTEEYNFIKDL